MQVEWVAISKPVPAAAAVATIGCPIIPTELVAMSARRTINPKTLGLPTTRRWGRSRAMTIQEMLVALRDTKIQPSEPRVGLETALQYTMAIGRLQAQEYQRRARRRRRSSFWFRLGGLLALVLGVLSPLLASVVSNEIWVRVLGNAGMSTELSDMWSDLLLTMGYVFMAVGGALMLADRVFLATSGWMRFVEAQVALEDRLVTLLFQWKIKQLQWGDQGPDRQTAVNELGFLCGTAESFMEYYKSERAKWAEDVRAGAGELQQKLALKRPAVPARSRSRMVPQRGAVETGQRSGEDANLQVRVSFSGKDPEAYALVALTVTGDPQPQEKRVYAAFPLAEFSAPQGTHFLTVATERNPQAHAEDVTIGPGLNELTLGPFHIS